MERPRRLDSCFTSVKAWWSRPRCGTSIIRASASSSRELTSSRRYPRITCSTNRYRRRIFSQRSNNHHATKLTYLDLGPPVPAGTLGDELSPSGTVAGNTYDFIMSATATDTHVALMSSMNVSRHVRFGLPHLLHPPSGVQSVTRLAGLDVGRRSTCPMNLLRLVATMSCRSMYI